MIDAELLKYLTPAELAQLDQLLYQEPADPFENLDDPVKWIESNFYVPETNGPVILGDYQRRCLREALQVDANGLYKYSLIVWSDLKKSIKSTVTAAVALWKAFNSPHGQILVVANDLKQADSRVGHYMRRAIELNPKLRELVSIKPSGYLITLPNKCTIESVPIDPKGEAGNNADMVIFSELWGADSKAQLRMWTETTLSPTKFGKSFRWVESYAGFEGESLLLWQLYEQGVRPEHQIWPDLEAFGNIGARQFTLWNTSPKLAWQTPEYYAQERAQLTPEEFNRVHRNQWVAPTNRFVPPEWVDAAGVPALPPLDQYEPCVVAIDAGTSSDNFAIVGVSCRYIDRDEIVQRVEPGVDIVQNYGYSNVIRQFIVRFVYLWEPKPGEPLQYSDPPTGPANPANPAPETVLRQLADKYHIVEFVYDPYQLHNMATNLRNAGVGYFVEMNQNAGGKRARADKNLFDLLRDGMIIHDGNPQLVEHIKNANKKVEGEGIRLQKRSNNSKIDLAVALSMACYEAGELNIGF